MKTCHVLPCTGAPGGNYIVTWKILYLNNASLSKQVMPMPMLIRLRELTLCALHFYHCAAEECI